MFKEAVQHSFNVVRQFLSSGYRELGYAQLGDTVVDFLGGSGTHIVEPCDSGGRGYLRGCVDNTSGDFLVGAVAEAYTRKFLPLRHTHEVGVLQRYFQAGAFKAGNGVCGVGGEELGLGSFLLRFCCGCVLRRLLGVGGTSGPRLVSGLRLAVLVGRVVYWLIVF